jgi:hypothetical protein
VASQGAQPVLNPQAWGFGKWLLAWLVATGALVTLAEREGNIAFSIALGILFSAALVVGTHLHWW